MVRVVTQATKTTPVIPVVEIERGNPSRYQIMPITTINPTDAYTSTLNLYTIDGSIDEYYFASAMIFSNDSSLILTGLESKFPAIYTIAGTSVTVRYVYFTKLEINHDFGRTDVFIPGYQTSITINNDGSTTTTRSPNTFSYNSNTYYPVNCSKLCYDDGASNYIFKLFPTNFLPNYAASNSSTYTNVDLSAVGKHYAFDYTNYEFLNSDSVAYVGTNNSLILIGQNGYESEIIGIKTIGSLASTMILTSN